MPTKKDLESKARSKGLDLWEYVVELLTELTHEAITSFESQTIEEGEQISTFHKMLQKHFPKVPDPNDLPILGSEEDIVSYTKRLAKKLMEDLEEHRLHIIWKSLLCTLSKTSYFLGKTYINPSSFLEIHF